MIHTKNGFIGTLIWAGIFLLLITGVIFYVTITPPQPELLLSAPNQTNTTINTSQSNPASITFGPDTTPLNASTNSSLRFENLSLNQSP